MGCSEARWNPGVGLCCRGQHKPRQGSLLGRIHCLVEPLGTQPKAYPSPVWFYHYPGLGPNLGMCLRQRQARPTTRVEQKGAECHRWSLALGLEETEGQVRRGRSGRARNAQEALQQFRQEMMKTVVIRMEGHTQQGVTRTEPATDVEDGGVRMDLNGMGGCRGPLGRQKAELRTQWEGI